MKVIINKLAREARLTKVDARRIVRLFLEILRDEVWDRRQVVLRDFGIFKVKVRKARKVTSLDGTVLELPAAEFVRFRPSRNWRTR